MGQVYGLGVGTPTPTPTRVGSALVIEVADDYVMFGGGPAATHVSPHLAAYGPMAKGTGDVGKSFDGEIIFAEELMALHL
jgi:hypothetical protein